MNCCRHGPETAAGDPLPVLAADIIASTRPIYRQRRGFATRTASTGKSVENGIGGCVVGKLRGAEYRGCGGEVDEKFQRRMADRRSMRLRLDIGPEHRIDMFIDMSTIGAAVAATTAGRDPRTAGESWPKRAIRACHGDFVAHVDGWSLHGTPASRSRISARIRSSS